MLPSIVVKPKMLGTMAGMPRGVQKYWFFWEMTSHVSVFDSLVRQCFHIYVSLQRPGLSCRGAEVDLHGLAVQADHRYSPIAEHGGRCPVVQVERVHLPVVAQRLFLMV